MSVVNQSVIHWSIRHHLCHPKGRFTRYDFVAYDKLTTRLRHELLRVNQTYNSLNGPKSCRRPVVSLSYATKSYRVNRPLKFPKAYRTLPLFLLFSLQTDHDECSASNPVCDDKAICQNNHGSYVCSCKAGFAGNGKTWDGKMSATISTNRLHFAVRQFSNGLQMTSKYGNVVRRTKWHTRR